MRIDEITRRGFLKGASAAALTSLAGKSNAASKWVFFYQDSAPTGEYGITKHYFDSNSIVKDGKFVEVWVKSITDTKTGRKFDSDGIPYVLEINLSNRTVKYPNIGSWIRISPDSQADFLIDALKSAKLI